MISLSSFYFACIMVFGVIVSYLPLYCQHLGFTSLQIAVVTATFCFAEAAFSVPWSLLADRFHKPHRIFMTGVWLCMFFSLFLPMLRSFVPFAISFLLFATFQASIYPQLDTLSIKESNAGRIRYGTVRAFGSIGFLFIAITGGAIIKFMGIGIVPVLIVACVASQLASSFFIPKISHQDGHEAPSISQLKRFIFTPKIFVFLFAGFMSLLSQGLYFGFFSIWLSQNGYDPFLIGVLWSIAMIAEIIALWKGSLLFEKFSTNTVFSISLVALAIRWIIFGLGAHLPLLIAGQILNAVSFGFFHLAAVRYMFENSPSNLKQTSQALYNTTAYGAGSTIGLLIAGALVDKFGIQHLFFLNAMIAFAGFLVFYIYSIKRRSPSHANDTLTTVKKCG